MIACFSIIRFISDHTESLPVPIIHQMMENNDIPCVLVPLLEYKPWLRTNHKGENEKFEDGKWQVIAKHDEGKVTKVEVQIWLTIYNMFMSADSSRKYEITTFRKQNLMRLRKYMNEVLLDQLPMLTPMLRGLEEMNLMADTNVQSKNSFIVQTLPEIRTKLLAGKNWGQIARTQMEKFFHKDAAGAKEDLDRIMNLYSSDVFEEFLEDPKCEECGDPATQRCSKCKLAWYCSRDCQLRQWKKHKPICKMFQESAKREAEANATRKEDMREEAERKAAKRNGGKKKPMIEELN